MAPLLVTAQERPGLLQPAVGGEQVHPVMDQPRRMETLSRAEVFSGGVIDFVQNGQVSASARIFRLFIGEPRKFQLPVSIFTGVTSNGFANYRQQEDVALVLINPGAGIFNMCFDASLRLLGRRDAVTSLLCQYQAGLRFLNIYNKMLLKNATFSNFIGGIGLTFVTGAWERNKTDSLGVFWFNLRGLISSNARSRLRQFFDEEVNPNLIGYSIGMGIEISRTLNMKAFYFRFLNNLEIVDFTRDFLQLSFVYSIR